MISKDEIKDRVLTENTAQSILNSLRELESNRARMQRRVDLGTPAKRPRRFRR